MSLFDQIKSVLNPQMTPEQEKAWVEAQVGYGFADYWWLRDSFVRMMLDIKGPIKGPWHSRNSVHSFVSLWGHPDIMDALRVRLKQVGKEADYRPIAELHQAAPGVKEMCNGAADEAAIQTVSDFVDRAAIQLSIIDRWFTREYWSQDFKPGGNHGEFEGMSIETAKMHAPFSR